MLVLATPAGWEGVSTSQAGSIMLCGCAGLVAQVLVTLLCTLESRLSPEPLPGYMAGKTAEGRVGLVLGSPFL